MQASGGERFRLRGAIAALLVGLGIPLVLAVPAWAPPPGDDPCVGSPELCADTRPPETSITSGPPLETLDRFARFDFASDEPDSSFRCAMDSEPFASCSTPYESGELPPGQHTFKVAATDAVGNEDSTPATRRFTVVDSTATVSRSDADIAFTDDRDTANRVSASADATSLRIHDARAAVRAGTGCDQVNIHTVACGSGGVSGLAVSLKGGLDEVDLGALGLPARIDGGSERDELRGGAASDTIHGGPGDDRFHAAATPDGADALDGGEGSDRVHYLTREAPVRVTLAGGSDDGDIATAEGDEVTGMEEAYGGWGHDHIAGTDGSERLFGGHYSGLYADFSTRSNGNDTLEGRGGDDVLGGGPGNDTARGGERTDHLFGNEGNDVLEGGEETDYLVPEAGNDTVRGGAGDDGLGAGGRAPDGADVFEGGDGDDVLGYGERMSAVRVTVGNGADDGDIAAGEGDDVHGDVESIQGGSGSDRLVGDDGPDRLLGDPWAFANAGLNDVIEGRGGDDILEGDAGDDTLDGGGGEDAVTADRQAGGLEHIAGSDTIAVRDGTPDTVTCGRYDDSVVGDDIDSVNADCEARDLVTMAPRNTAPPTVVIGGEPADARHLLADRGEWSGSPVDDYAFQWLRCDSRGFHCVDIAGETAEVYDLVAAADRGRTFRVRVTATNSAGTVEATSAPAAPDIAASPMTIASPAIFGRARQGNVLTASPGRWSGTAPMRYAFRWLRCNSSGRRCRPLGGPQARAYRLRASDVGRRLRVEVTAENVAGSTTATSRPSALVRRARGR